jgi:hypothetical protein
VGFLAGTLLSEGAEIIGYAKAVMAKTSLTLNRSKQ